MKIKHSLYIALLSILLTACAKTKTIATTRVSTVEQTQMKKVLVYTKTLGWRHASIETGLETFKAFGQAHNFTVEHTEDSLLFKRKLLFQYDAIVFLSTTGNVLDGAGQDAFEKYIQGGGSFLGIHAAADTEYDWPWYGKLVGGYFESHPNDPNIRTASVQKTANRHKTVAHFSDTFSRNDEWYNYKNIDPSVTTVLTLNESSYEGGTHGDFHPIAWYHYYDGGKSFYTGGGHTKEAFAEDGFRKHLEEAILWCLE
jgi:type 1 glutamine amidotransferase